MRNLMCVLALLALTLPTAAYANEEETAPAAEPLIFINTNSNVGSLIAINTGFSRFAEVAREEGYRIDHGFRTSITEENLEGVAVYVLPGPGFVLLDEDKIALRRFIRAGGGLIVFGWHSVDLSNLSSFVREFSVEIYDYESATRTATVPASCPVSGPYPCSSLISLYRTHVRILNNNNAIAIAILDNNKTIGAISIHKNLGSGKLVVLGDLAMFATASVGGNIGDADNEAFVRNVLVYLQSGCDLRVTLCKAKLKGGKVKVTAKVRNVGTSASEATIVSFYLSSSDTYPVGPAGVAARIGSVNLPALNPGKSKKVKVKLNIPGWVTPGDYYVIAVADPDGDIRDSNTDNNYKASKKKITID